MQYNLVTWILMSHYHSSSDQHTVEYIYFHYFAGFLQILKLSWEVVPPLENRCK